jgi:ADP-ribose pyrophosphatase
VDERALLQPWKTLKRATILQHNRFLSVENHVVELPDGQIISDWPWVVTPDFVNIIAVTTAGQFICFRQTKYAIDGTSLAFAGGYIEPGESPADAARRELLEETGCLAREWIDLGQYSVDANRGVGVAYFFLAMGAEEVAEPDADDLEEQQLLLLTRDELESALAGGEIKVLSWAAIAALALQHPGLQT